MTIGHHVHTVVAALAIVGATSLPSAFAQQSIRVSRPQLRAEAGPASTVEGELIRVDAARRTIIVLTADRRREAFRYTDMTLVNGEGRAATRLADADWGAKVTVRYSKDGARRVASEITVHADAP